VEGPAHIPDTAEKARGKAEKVPDTAEKANTITVSEEDLDLPKARTDLT
jgi:hypothetical protein